MVIHFAAIRVNDSHRCAETAIANPTNDSHPAPRHDILEVNNYFMSGLVVSSIDKWFMGPVPRFPVHDMGLTGEKQDLSATLERSRKAAESYVPSVSKFAQSWSLALPP
jgi:hypothetical protein